VRPLSFDHGAFNSLVVDLVVIVSFLPFVLKICVGASGDGVDFVMGREIVALLRWLADLEWMWQGQIGFCFVLVGWIVWCWVGDLWKWQRVCYLWYWRGGLGVIGRGINDRTDNRTEIVLGYCLDEFIGKIEMDTMGSMVGEMVATALYG
jgi:hypothetical protein